MPEMGSLKLEGEKFLGGNGDVCIDIGISR